MKMNINGTEIFVERLPGKGDLSFVLIHNAGGDHRFFTHQIKTLQEYGDVIQLDLPGHGNSDLISSYTMDELSSIVARICESLSLKNICLIGLNNGANIVLNAALKQTLPIKSVILIDPPIFMEPSFIAEINHFIEKLEDIDLSDFVKNLVNVLFFHTDASNKEIAARAFLKVDKKSLQNIFRGLIEWDTNSSGLLKNISYPTLCILTDEHHCSYKKLNQEAPHFDIAKVVGSKCWATLEVPEQINAMIGRFLNVRCLAQT